MPLELLQCEYRAGRHKEHGCWQEDWHLCEFLECNVIPAEQCFSCRIPLYMTSTETGATAYLDQLQSVLIQSSPNVDYVIDDETHGIITVGGGKYWPGIYVMIKMVRELGYQGAIEVWYRGDCEKIYPEDVQGLNVDFINIDEMVRIRKDSRIPSGDVKKGGWEAKLYALYHTTLRRVFYIDADAYFVNDPTVMFSLLEQASFVFWQDLPAQANAVKWKEVYPDGYSHAPPQIQGGQILIDRLSAWKLVHASHYMCQHSDFYFKKLYGDQDTWRVGLSAGASTYLNLGKAPWTEGVAFLCSHNDVPYVIHRCQGKLYAPHDIPKGKKKYSSPRYNLPHEAKVFNLMSECIAKRANSSEEVFANIYAKKLWGEGSGSGSKLKEAKPYIDSINNFIRSNDIYSVVDAGCGDGLVGSLIQVTVYVGVECTSEMFNKCVAMYGKQNRGYQRFDVYEQVGQLLSADVLLCKDVLHHWPTNMVEAWVRKLIESRKWKYIFFCQDYKQNRPEDNCHLGGYRALNHAMFPLALFKLEKVCDVGHKHLLLWRNPDAN